VQNYGWIEVVDDGSTDDSHDVIWRPAGIESCPSGRVAGRPDVSSTSTR
jgi:hypothetical protein